MNKQTLNLNVLAKLAFIILLIFPTGCAVKNAYTPTLSSKIEIKKIPASKVMIAKANGSYYDNSGPMFRELFDYIQTNEVSMTAPVEGGLDKGYMIFYVGDADINKDLINNEAVTIEVLPERQVASISANGSYTKENIQKAEIKLQEWLAQNKDYKVIGEPQGVFWNSPFVPGFMKQFEVHIEVLEIKDKT